MEYSFEAESRKVFNAFIKSNVTVEQFKNVYFMLNDPEYFKFLPDNIKKDEEFVKEAAVKGLYYYNLLPLSLQNTEFITKGLYIKMLSNGMVSLDKNLYPQDEEIGLSVLEFSKVLFYKLDEKLIHNKDFIIKAIKKNPRVYDEISFDMKEEVVKDKNIIMILLEMSPRIHYVLPEEYKLDKDVLLKMLESPPGYEYIKDNILNKSHDKEVILKALKIYKGSYKHINKIYSSIISKAGSEAKDNPYEFMRNYFLAVDLDNSLPTLEHKPKSNKI